MSGYDYSRESDSYQRYDDQDRYGGGGGGRRSDYEESSYTETDTSYSTGQYGRPSPPQVPFPWQAHWSDQEGRWYFEHEQTRERVWSVEEVETRVRSSGGGGGYGGGSERVYEQTNEYSQSSGYGGGGYGGSGYGGGRESEQVYQSEEVDESRGSGGSGHGHGLAYGLAGAAAGAFALYEGEKIHQDYDEDKYKVENFEERVEDDVVDAPENVSGWVGEKVGDVERFDDNVDNSYDQGRDDSRYGTDY